MAKGTYERTPLINARQRLAWNTKRVERLKSQLSAAKHEHAALKQEIAQLEKAESK